MKLPSRNWMIFWTITGSFTGAIIYDKRETRRAQRKWCKVVEHISQETLDTRTMPRKLTVFLESPPTDGLRVAQDHFKDYVKPILVASGLDWDFIQGRKEGDVRAELAEKIRHRRNPPADPNDEEDPIVRVRRQAGVQDFDGAQGDIVIGRHTWKEYVRGLHEGWLGPLEAPPAPVSAPAESTDIPAEETPADTLPGITIHSSEESGDAPKPAEPVKPEKPKQPPPFISTADYSSASLPSQLPNELDPSIPIQFPHILGFLNTPLRMYRFLNARHLQDSIGREIAAIILSTYRPYHDTAPQGDAYAPTSDNSPTEGIVNTTTNEQQAALVDEEKDWHKSVYKRVDGEGERTWLEPIVLDERIASRMRRADLTAEAEERARNIVVPEEEIEGTIKGTLRGWYRGAHRYFFEEEKKVGYVGDLE